MASPKVPQFDEFAHGWLAIREPELRPKTIASYRWQLKRHLVPYFGCSVREVDMPGGLRQDLGIASIDAAASPHSLRRLYASLRFALRDDPVYVAEQLGHTDPTFSIKVYARAVRRRERLYGIALCEFDKALDWAARSSFTQ